MLWIKIVGALLALGLGLYLGLAAPYRPDPREIDRALSGGGVSRRAKRHFTPLGWLRRNTERSSYRRLRTRGGRRRPFDLSSPTSKKD